MQPATKPGDSTSAHPLLAWPIGVQIALGFLITAGLFFLLGRLSLTNERPSLETIATADGERSGLDLNRATRGELRLLPGVGDSLAQRVVEYRQQRGPFRSVDDLRQVAGIGPKTLERLRPFVFVSGEESFVSTEEGESMSTESRPMVGSKPAPLSKKASELTEPIHVNRASQTELQKLPGIGPKLSQRILDERARAPFKTVDDLRRVSGIGPKTLEKLRPHITID